MLSFWFCRFSLILCFYNSWSKRFFIGNTTRSLHTVTYFENLCSDFLLHLLPASWLIYIYRDESSISTIKKKSEAVSMTMNRKSFNNLWFRTSLQIYSCVSVLWCLSVPSFDSIRGETSWCVQAHVSISEVYTAEDTRCCRDVFRCSS